MDPSEAPKQGALNITRRQFVAGVGLAAIGTVIAACVPGSSGTSAPASSVVAGPATPSVAAGASGTALADLSGQTGVLWGLKYDPHVAAYQRMADLFKQK